MKDLIYLKIPGECLGTNVPFGNQWEQSIEEAKILGIDYTSYSNLDELQWDITRKTAQETIRTGKNPLRGSSSK